MMMMMIMMMMKTTTTRTATRTDKTRQDMTRQDLVDNRRHHPMATDVDKACLGEGLGLEDTHGENKYRQES